MISSAVDPKSARASPRRPCVTTVTRSMSRSRAARQIYGLGPLSTNSATTPQQLKQEHVRNQEPPKHNCKSQLESCSPKPRLGKVIKLAGTLPGCTLNKTTRPQPSRAN